MVKVVEISKEQENALFGTSHGNSRNMTQDTSRPSTEQLIKDWLRQDRDPHTRKAIEIWKTIPNIDSWLYPRIAFGTAGLRAEVGPGYARMNNLVVLQTSQGLARWILRQKLHPDAEKHSVVIGYDGRANSKEFAKLAASAMLAYSIQVIWFGKMVHTPLVAFTVKHMKASAGIMITASHNPKDDNGYKVYAGNGCQINTPVDEEIQSAILEDLEVPQELWDVSAQETLQSQGDEMQDEYQQAVIRDINPSRFSTPQRFVYTPLHGTGLEIFSKVLEGLLQKPNEELLSEKIYIPVPEQSQPHPAFPTVKFPNPEENGALDLAQALAEREDISMILANDPDADRFAAAERSSDGSWYQLKGDEVGALLGYYVFQKFQAAGIQTLQRPKMYTSAVSSSFLATMGQQEGFVVEETLTGFKWIGNAALKAFNAKEMVLFGYEEALGYMLPQVCYDKDGISAAMLFLQASTQWKRELDKTPLEVLQDLYQQYGWFETANTYFKSPSVEVTGNVFKDIQARPEKLLESLPKGTKVRVRDALAGTDTGESNGKSRLPVIPGNLMITFWPSGTPELGDGTRLTIRASGTEPKIKIYIECQSKKSKKEAKDGALLVLKAVASTWFADSRFVIEERFQSLVQ